MVFRYIVYIRSYQLKLTIKFNQLHFKVCNSPIDYICCLHHVTVQMAERELAQSLIYTQRARRLEHGNNIGNVAVTSTQSAVEQGSTLTVQQKMKQFDAARREQWHEQEEVRPTFVLSISYL